MVDPDPMELVLVGRGGASGKRGRLLRRWMLTVKVGDVLENASGTQRVVRAVSRDRCGNFGSVTFAIKHCSWTRRPLTIVNFTDLRQQGYRPVGVNVRLDGELDAWLEADVKSGGAVCALLAALLLVVQALARRAWRDADPAPPPAPAPPRVYNFDHVRCEHVGPGAYRRPECPTPTCVQPVDCRASDRCMSLPIKRINP